MLQPTARPSPSAIFSILALVPHHCLVQQTAAETPINSKLGDPDSGFVDLIMDVAVPVVGYFTGGVRAGLVATELEQIECVSAFPHAVYSGHQLWSLVIGTCAYDAQVSRLPPLCCQSSQSRSQSASNQPLVRF